MRKTLGAVRQGRGSKEKGVREVDRKKEKPQRRKTNSMFQGHTSSNKATQFQRIVFKHACIKRTSVKVCVCFELPSVGLLLGACLMRMRLGLETVADEGGERKVVMSEKKVVLNVCLCLCA